MKNKRTEIEVKENMQFSLNVSEGTIYSGDISQLKEDRYIGSEIEPVMIGHTEEASTTLCEYWLIVQHDEPVLVERVKTRDTEQNIKHSWRTFELPMMEIRWK